MFTRWRNYEAAFDRLANENPDSVATVSGPVVTRYRSACQNLRTTFDKIIKRAGLNPWPKPFQNLRSTRETELMETYPAHVVVSWIGHSEAVARKHYLQTTDLHFEKAVAVNAIGGEGHRQGHKACEMAKTGETDNEEDPAKTQFFTGSCGSVSDASHQENNPTRARTPAANRWANCGFQNAWPHSRPHWPRSANRH